VKKVNQVGRYAASEEVDGLELMKMVMELPEKDKMLMWSQGYINLVVEKMPEYARDILEDRKEKWEDTKAFYLNQIEEILNDEEFKKQAKGERKEFALFVKERYRDLQALLFAAYDGKITEEDVRKFVYRRKFGGRKKYLH
jgi:3-oxoacyl-[acyl-carrier-protein] synthase III